MRRKEARRAQRMQNEIGDTAANNATAAVSNKQLLQATDAAKNEPATAAQLRFIMGRNDSAESLDEDEDYDMHALSKAEKQRKKKAERYDIDIFRQLASLVIHFNV